MSCCPIDSSFAVRGAFLWRSPTRRLHIWKLYSWRCTGAIPARPIQFLSKWPIYTPTCSPESLCAYKSLDVYNYVLRAERMITLGVLNILLHGTVYCTIELLFSFVYRQSLPSCCFYTPCRHTRSSECHQTHLWSPNRKSSWLSSRADLKLYCPLNSREGALHSKKHRNHKPGLPCQKTVYPLPPAPTSATSVTMSTQFVWRHFVLTSNF